MRVKSTQRKIPWNIFVARRRLNPVAWCASAGFTCRDDFTSWCDANGIEDPGGEVIPASLFCQSRSQVQSQRVVCEVDLDIAHVGNELDLQSHSSPAIDNRQSVQDTDHRRVKTPRKNKVQRDSDIETVVEDDMSTTS